ncbi:S-methyl-5'-thioadenosine phosphorylase [Desulfosudis oleivorans]|uniref:Purine nucleoside phosphorylase n=1 Tax=Desulfosudis oleivorans (strain DSM 6200 / JCM 39069 / Hxd3) TaxID=96561 RepID=A8ZWU0_DESOH|nr:S-methyl-5'-thioadenosine phosphorylase [Desulfosudis oleivorans]ABW68421.1 methylthioadenosine phosphorylase [Desulfosudis oleivorans Hxd3]
MKKIGIIGGSGLEDPDILQNAKDLEVITPYGEPTSPLVCGAIDGVEVMLISRHGRRHQFSPSEVNYRANIHALKDQGATHILATTACGSLKEKIHPGDFVILDQFIDFAKMRKNTFFDSFEHLDLSAHSPMADPFDKHLRDLLIQSGRELGLPIHETGTVVTIEGPRFSTRAESRMFQAWGADVINMSVATEAALANEAQVPYAAVAMSTDYDCWRDEEETVSWEAIMEVFHSNAEHVKQLLITAVSKI